MTPAEIRTRVATSIMSGVTSAAVRSIRDETIVNIAPADGDKARAILAAFEYPYEQRAARNGAVELRIPARAFA